jgi:RNA polymerase-interacting CarD/CdnL/TRCF family regulator
MKTFFKLMILSLICMACNDISKKAKHFEKVLEASDGHEYSVAKTYTQQSNYVVFKDETTGTYTAYNLENYNRRKMKTLDDYKAGVNVSVDIVSNLTVAQEWEVSGHWDYYTTYESYYDPGCDCYGSYETTHYTDTWIDTSSWVTYYYGNGLKFSNTSSMSKDLEMLAALEEEAVEQWISVKLSSDYALSNDRAAELAQLLTKYQKLENQRELTASEKNYFAQESLGVSMGDLENSLKEKALGQDNNYQKLLNEAAVLNRTTPEQIGRFLNDYMGSAIE